MSKYKTKVVRATKIIAKVAYLMIQCYFEYIVKVVKIRLLFKFPIYDPLKYLVLHVKTG